MRYLTILGLLMCAFAASAGNAPKWFDQMLAGYKLDYDEKRGSVGVYDAASGYYLVRGIDCDGGHIRLMLTKDRRLVGGEYKIPGYKHKQFDGSQALKNAPLRNLSTGKGVLIGMTPAQLTSKLGKPTQIKKTGKNKQYTELRYIWRDVKNGEGTSWANVYVFKSGKLIEISFYRDSVPGCGGDEPSWEGINDEM